MSQEQWIDLGLNATYVLLGVALVAAILMNFANALKDPRSLIKGGIGIVVLLIVFFIGYSIAPAEIGRETAKSFEAIDIDPTSEEAVSTFRWVGGAMSTTFILIIIAVVGLVYSSVSRIFR